MFNGLQKYNPFSEKFLEKETEIFADLNKEIQKNTFSIPNTVDAFHSTMPDTQFSSYTVMLTDLFRDKMSRINYYRAMSFYPPVLKAISIICDECVSEDALGKYAKLNLDNEFSASLRPLERKQLQIEFEYIMEVVFRAKEDNALWDLFFRWLVDGELFLELIANTRGNALIGYNILPPQWSFPIYRGNAIEKYVETPQYYQNRTGQYIPSTDPIYFEENQLSYTNYGMTGYTKQDVLGYLEPARRSYAQMRSMEDSLVIMRLNRAVERRIWNIEIGMEPEGKARNIMDRIKTQYRKIMNYNPESGDVEQRKNYISMNEDIFFPMRDGKKSSVENFNGNTVFNTQLDDLKMTMQLLYDSLQLPDTRWGAEAESMYTNKNDMALKEMNFAKFCGRLQNRFKKHIEDFFIEHLRLRNYDKEYLNRANYQVKMNKNNKFEEFKSLELSASRLDLLNSAANFILSSDNVNGSPMFSKEYFLKSIFGMNDVEINLNNELLEKEIKDLKKVVEAAGAGAEAPPV